MKLHLYLLQSAFIILNSLLFFLHAVFKKSVMLFFYRDNKLLVSGTQDGDLFLWSMETQSLNRQLPSMFLFIFIFEYLISFPLSIIVYSFCFIFRSYTVVKGNETAILSFFLGFLSPS
jgi:hypothetical protein